MEMNRESSYTGPGEATLPVNGGQIEWESSDLCLIAVFERHGRAGTTGYGLVRGALREGAVAMTWAHDSHNLMVMGRSAVDMAAGPQVAKFRAAVADLGFVHRSPIMTLGILTLAVSPALKVTDRGLVDVDRDNWSSSFWNE